MTPDGRISGALGGSSRDATLFGLSGSGLRSLGIALVVLGLLFFVGGALYGFSSVSAPTFGTNPTTSFQDTTSRMMGAFALSAIGVLLFGIGGWALRFGLVRPVASYVAEEAAPAITVASAAIGRGLEEARIPTTPGPAAVQTVVKVKCKACSHLNEESAKFCDECGQPL